MTPPAREGEENEIAAVMPRSRLTTRRAFPFGVQHAHNDFCKMFRLILEPLELFCVFFEPLRSDLARTVQVDVNGTARNSSGRSVPKSHWRR